MYLSLYISIRCRVTAASSGTHTHAGARVQAPRPCALWRARLRDTEATGGGPQRYGRRYRRGSIQLLYTMLSHAISFLWVDYQRDIWYWEVVGAWPIPISIYLYIYLSLYIDIYIYIDIDAICGAFARDFIPVG